MNSTATTRMVDIVRREYCEMPELRLTVPQAARLWTLDPADAQALLEELARGGFLVRDTDHCYARWDAATFVCAL